MADEFKVNSQETALPNTEPQAPRSIPMSVVHKDEATGRNNEPYNPGGEPHAPRCPVN